jgi:7-cyano-7-deazaguanine synthase
MDSAVTAAIAAEHHRLALLHANYGQRTELRELASFHRIADHYGVAARLVIDFPALRAIGGSSLIDPTRPIPTGWSPPGEIPSTYVPFRNAHLLSAATSWAEVLEARAIFIGAVWEDSSGYPDCRPDFYRAFEQAIHTGTRCAAALRIETPIIRMTKAEIVGRGADLGVPFELTWSCYQSEEEACGLCESCLLRLRGFEQAGRIDPLPYRQRGQGSRP